MLTYQCVTDKSGAAEKQLNAYTMHHSHLNVSNNNRLGICESLSTGTFSFTLSFIVKLTVTSIGKVIPI